MRLTRVNERRNNRGGSPIFLIAIMAVGIVVLLILIYWFFIRSTEDSTPSTSDESKTAQGRNSRIADAEVPWIIRGRSAPPGVYKY